MKALSPSLIFSFWALSTIAFNVLMSTNSSFMEISAFSSTQLKTLSASTYHEPKATSTFLSIF